MGRKQEFSALQKCDMTSVLSVFFLLINGIQGYVQSEHFLRDLDKPVPTSKVQGVVGKKAALPCDTQPLTAEDMVSMVLWFKEANGEPLYSYDVRGRTTTQPRLWSSPTIFGSRAYFRASAAPSVLLIDNVAATDAGVYRCRVDFKNSPTRNSRIEFNVITPPGRPVIMDMKTKDQTQLLEPYNEGDTVELSCETQGGEPKPSLVWYLENTVIDDSYTHRSDGVTVNNLTFPNVGRQHLNARLVCQASNTNVSTPQSKLLIMDINLKPLTVQIMNKGRQLSADRSYEVECMTAGSRPDALVTWWKGGRQLKRGVKVFSKTNVTTSLLTFVPVAEDHDQFLVCRAENPRLPLAVLEDRWRLNVHYVPVATLKLGSSLNPGFIKEGDDVYFECNVRANPKSDRMTWYKGDQEIQQNATAGVILSDQSLVLQVVSRTATGDYSCLAQNSEGSARSNAVTLQVRYAPSCKTEDNLIYGALKGETVHLNCAVDSSPEPYNFSWTFTGSGESRELDNSFYTVSGHQSVLRYSPIKASDYGTILCTSTNAVGKQQTPCVYKIVIADRPSRLQNCSIVSHNSLGLVVDCVEGSDGGLPQVFFMEVLELPSLSVKANVSSNATPSFEVYGLDRGASFALKLYAANSKGRSDIITLYTVALRSPDKYIGPTNQLPVSPMLVSLLAAVALLCAGVCGVIAALYRRHAANSRSHKIPPLSALTPDYSEDSFHKHDNTSTYCASPKLDYTSQYELKMEEVEDPDVIPCQYDKKPIEYKIASPSEERIHRICNEQILSLPSSVQSTHNIALVNRGVTARSSDIAAARHRQEYVTTPSSVKESCI